MARRSQDTFTCPNCGADVRVGAAACPECGADEETGWSEQTAYDGLDLPGPEWGGDEESGPRSRVSWSKVVAVALAILVVLFVLLNIW